MSAAIRPLHNFNDWGAPYLEIKILHNFNFLGLVNSLVVETFNPEKNGREAYFILLETSFFIEKHIQNPLESLVGKSFYGCPRFCIIPIIPIIMTNHFCHRNYTVAAANDLS